ncbi:MAG: methylated-DNA--[protein]-cysteine S-methyltransferase [Nocardioidaceae bacterium]
MSRNVMTIGSPAGPMELVSEDDMLVKAHFVVESDAGRAADNASGVAPELSVESAVDASPRAAPSAEVSTSDADPDPLLAAVEEQLRAYFAGKQQEFSVPMAASGTDFQKRVWAELVRIPYGATASYGEIAKRLGLPSGASRAVGLANGRNPIAILVPCHRVIGANGKLVGYAGGLERKKQLLNLEASHAGQAALFA